MSWIWFILIHSDAKPWDKQILYLLLLWFFRHATCPGMKPLPRTLPIFSQAWGIWRYRYRQQTECFGRNIVLLSRLSIFAINPSLPSPSPWDMEPIWNLIRWLKHKHAQYPHGGLPLLQLSWAALALIKFWNFLFCWSSLKRLTASLWWLQNSP